MTDQVFKTIENIVGEGNVSLNEPLSAHTTFKIGGPSDIFVCVQDVASLSKLISYLKKIDVAFYILGNGSNLLVKDKGFRGAMITLSGEFKDIDIDGTLVTVGAGALMSNVGAQALKHSLTGFEFAAGIPGSVGGGIIMNAGAYGGELKDITKTVYAMDYEGNVLEISNQDMKFEYRNSALKNRPFIVLKAVFELAKGDPDQIKATMQDLAAKRRDKQPLEFPSAGSTFKRPEGYFAGKLIQDSGLSGYSVGDAQVSPKHNGFVVNNGEATAEDVLKLIGDVTDRVKESFGVTLEPEVIVIGE